MIFRENDMENLKGTIFDVRRFATHDGGGIRTTVFFKGCQLLCAWCHNPEGISTKRRALYFDKKCIHCGSCVKNSKCGGMTFQDEKIVLDHTKSEDWDELIQICPTGAIAWDSREIDVYKLFGEVMSDAPFFKYDGGVTLSGGEPLLQPDFAGQLLKLLQDRGIHTAIETALLVPIENLKKVLPYLNHIFADCKIFDESEHIRATKVSNKLIIQNLEYLLTSDKKRDVVIRTPMIPEYTATEKNVAEIAKFISGIFPEVNYEILNYNPLALAKYHLVGREFCFKENPKRFSKEQMNHFAEIAHSNGVRNVFIDE
ncbi:MAG: glycyl-radical enzyme activating protein [Selenomonadaceae bacterium]|nr:glycyl-radical enzyme activating protein [Selenomonadaceae bacterium]